MKKIWLIGGTGDSVAIATILRANKIPFVVSVATLAARTLYSNETQVFVGCMALKQMQLFCQQENIIAIVDASHPYAVEVSQNAILTKTKLNLSYLRYERSNFQSRETSVNSVTKLDSFDALLQGNYLNNQKVLLTIGCQTLPLFKSWHGKSTLYARILPKIESLEIALAAGFTSDRLIAIRPPIDLELEKALWQQWNISLMITKASGKAGGEDIKRQAAADLNIPLIVINRPKITYPRQTSSLQEILTFCQLLYV